MITRYFAAFLLCESLAGCSRTDSAMALDAQTTATQVNAAISDAGTNGHLILPHDAGPPPACRIVEAKGTTPEVTAGDHLPAGFLKLAATGRLIVRHPKSLRESTFLGPGEVQACASGAELHQLRQGTFVSAPGSGEAPGHDAWVVTPVAVVRYGVGGVTVQMDAKGHETVTVASGTARVWHPHVVTGTVKLPANALDSGAPASPTDLYSWTLLRDGTSMTLAPTAGADSGDVEAECLADARASADLARALRSDASTPFGERAVAHMTTFEATKAACSIARMRLSCAAGDAVCEMTLEPRMLSITAALLTAETGEEVR